MVKEMAIGKSSKILFNKSLMMEEQNNPQVSNILCTTKNKKSV